MTHGRTAYRQKTADCCGIFAPASGNASNAPHIRMQMACFEAAPSNLHASVFRSRSGFSAGPRLLAPAVCGPQALGQSLADLRDLCFLLRNYPLCWRVSALDSGVIITLAGGRNSCAPKPSSSPFSRPRALRAAWTPKASVLLPVGRPGPSSPMQPTRTWSPVRRSAPLLVARAATPASAVPATADRTIIHPPARVANSCRHRGFPPRWRFVSPALTAHDITKGGAGQSAPGGRD